MRDYSGEVYYVFCHPLGFVRLCSELVEGVPNAHKAVWELQSMGHAVVPLYTYMHSSVKPRAIASMLIFRSQGLYSHLMLSCNLLPSSVFKVSFS